MLLAQRPDLPGPARGAFGPVRTLTVERILTTMRSRVRVPLLPAAGADLQCTLYPAPRVQLAELRAKIAVFGGVVVAIGGLTAMGQPLQMAVAAVAVAGLIGVEVSTRLIGPMRETRS